MDEDHYEFKDEGNDKSTIIDVLIKEVHSMHIHHGCEDKAMEKGKDCFTMTLLILNIEGVTEILAFDLKTNSVEKSF